MEFKKLRKKHPKFIYEKYSFKISKRNLNISFDFKIAEHSFISHPRYARVIEPDICFTPRVIIENIPQSRVRNLNKKILNNLIFHLGLIEALSYWKASCSPEIEIKAGYLDKEQILWWKNLMINGMGQFFYENKINFRQPNFLKINNLQGSYPCKTYQGKLGNRVLVPIGGGKDSVVTLEILKNLLTDGWKKINCFSLNPIKPAQKVMKMAGFKNPIIVRRKIDKKLLELNQKGYLNGHTPFSAYLAFLSVLLAVIFDYTYIAFSNERSSNEGNLKYLGKIINHQYSKSFDFEKRFRNYSKKYLVKGVEYFSFLRPLYEIQIAKLFSQYSKYFPIFLSCNEAYKTDSGRKKPIKKWCGKCPKCLFVFASLYPFIESKKLIKIFRKNLFEDRKLSSLMLQLIGKERFKPFECVGTKKESLVAFYLSWKKTKRRGKMPVLLKYFENKILPKHKNLERESQRIINSWLNQHNLPRNFEKALRASLDKF